MTVFPQRLDRVAPIGSLLKSPIATTRTKDHHGERDADYLEMVRQCPCLKCGLDIQPGIEAAHVRMQSGTFYKHGGTSKKPSDCWALPLCGGPLGCHAEQHKKGERLFWHEVGINPLPLCEKLYAKRGDIVAMRAVVLLAIAERR